MSHQQSDIDHLISQYLNRRASESQRQELEEWLASSPKNRETFHRLEKVWSTSSPIRHDNKINDIRDRIWNNAQRKSEITESPKIARFYWIKVAAIFLLIIAGGWLYTEIYQTQETQIPEAITWIEKTNPSGQRSSHLLPDGTKVWLNVASQLSFPEEFSDTLRQVKLIGEAFFEVSKDAAKPFVVETEDLRTLVLGTAFNIHAYPEYPEVRVALLEGKVQVQNKDPFQVQTSILSPGEELLAPKNNQAFTKQQFQYDETFGWKEGILIFDGTDFQSFRTTIEKWYGVKVELEGTAPHNWNMRARYQRATLQHVLDDISFNKNMKYEIEEKTVIITF